MRTTTSLCLWVFSATYLLLGCSGNDAGNERRSGVNGDGATTGGGSTLPGQGIDTPGIDVSVAACGNGELNMNEQCDDKNNVGGDGCSPSCQVEAGWECAADPGIACTETSVCGDGKLGATESCDDGNTNPEDGCTANCMLEPGWQCRMPGSPCVPLCGDGVLAGPEQCDDGNTTSGDGCSTSCFVEPGSSCAGTPSVCTQAVCGNGMQEVGEACDLGPENGLFHGDGSGCSKTCTVEPTCRTGAETHACSSTCGDANVDPGELCDDGNLFDGDGCSSTCMVEAGFGCSDQTTPDSEACPSNPAAQCLLLPVVYRDFDGQHEPTGHPDFFFLGATPAGGTKTVCVPNASGRPVGMNGSCWDSDATALCQGTTAPMLGADGKPTIGATTECACRFTDWDNTGILTGVAGTTTCNSGDANPTRIETTVSAFRDAMSFSQWYADSTFSTPVVGSLELAAMGEAFQFSSSNGRTVYDDLHDIFMGTAIPATNGAPANSLSSGFFPLEDQPRAKVCNLWPYWSAGLDASTCVADDGNPVWQQWDPRGSYAAGMEGTGGPVRPVTGVMRNHYFTSEARYLLRYVGGEQLTFNGDDTVWVYINGRLALDLGAPHERLLGTVTLNGAGATWTIQTADLDGTLIEVGSGSVDDLGIAPGNTYEIVVFHADVHPRESNYQLTLSGFSTTRSFCEPACGDAIVTPFEECDLGPENNDTVYGGCTTQCTFGPFCGDGNLDAEFEQCDLGRMNGATYGGDGCTSNCQLPARCGDGVVQAAYGEECDAGANNGLGDCLSDCKIVPM